jgi:hypothetical protein
MGSSSGAVRLMAPAYQEVIRIISDFFKGFATQWEAAWMVQYMTPPGINAWKGVLL